MPGQLQPQRGEKNKGGICLRPGLHAGPTAQGPSQEGPTQR